LKKVVASGTPFVGICLGLQLLFDSSEEAPDVPGLGLLPGRCVRFPSTVKVPQIGWNRVQIPDDMRAPSGSPMAADDGQHFYFVHSYHAVCDDASDVVARADHGGPFTAAVWRDNLLAMQFHPEKSGAAGLALLRRCLDSSSWRRGAASC